MVQGAEVTPSIVLSVVELAHLGCVSSAPSGGSVVPAPVVGPIVDLGKARRGFVVCEFDAAPSPSPTWSPAWTIVVRSRRDRRGLARRCDHQSHRRRATVCPLGIANLNRFIQIQVRAARCGADATNLVARLEHA